MDHRSCLTTEIIRFGLLQNVVQMDGGKLQIAREYSLALRWTKPTGMEVKNKMEETGHITGCVPTLYG